MTTKTRLDKAINGLHEVIRRNQRQDEYIFGEDKLVIDNSSPQIGTIILISLMLLLPFGLVLYYFLVDNANTIIFWLLLLEIILVNDFYKLLRGNNTLIINFKEKYIQTDNALTKLKKIFPGKTIPFSLVNEVALKKRVASWQQQWFQLLAYDKDDKAFVLTDFSKSYPESLIAEKVKFLFDVIIWTEKRNTVVTV